MDMKTFSVVLLFWALIVSPVYTQSRRGKANVSEAQLQDVVRKEFGDQVKVQPALNSEPFYLLGDFNGDGRQDIAVLVNIEQGRAELKQHGVKYLDADPHSRTNGSEIDPKSAMGHNCIGIAIIHGTSDGWNVLNPAGKFLVYDCFSAFRLFRKGQRIRRGSGSQGPTPKPKGDSIFLDLETGGTSLIYWNGRTYRGFGLRGGD
jgi:hypothetical protein